MLVNHTGITSNNSSKPIGKCVICQDPLDINVANLSGCSHQFHKSCIDNWKNITNQCPVCRKRFNYIEQGHRKYKVEQKDQKNDDGLTDEYLNALAEEPCQICQSSDYSELGLLCDGCDKCYHTHCLGLNEIPEGDWYCDTCKHLQSDYESPQQNRRGFLRRLENRERNRRNRSNNRYYNLNDNFLTSNNENNKEWLQTQDEDWIPNENQNDDDISSENNEEFDELKQNELILSEEEIEVNENNNINGLNKFSFKKKKNRKRKRNVIENDINSENELFEMHNNNNKRRKLNNNNNNKNKKESPLNNILQKRSNNRNNNNTQTWNCNVCTFTNERKYNRCVMCETKRVNNNKNNNNNNNNKKNEIENKLSIYDYFSDTNDRKRDKNKNKINVNESKKSNNNKIKLKKKYSRFNPYIKKKTYSPFPDDNNNNNLRRSGLSINNVIGNDILSKFDLNDDLYSMADIEDGYKVNTSNENNNEKIEMEKSDNNNHKNNKNMIDDIDDCDDDEFQFKPKPKMKYRDRYKKLNLSS